ncbi:signal peptidase II [Paeniroseomonas aquatica]|uniref:Lipoprotein signal peptidase n=1 Tax=Paeniroseomonas aquatica TaxID=373043 RepID=A0ABT8AFK9_9PROT|nr:signal peptidase II [Paeniroseomonas aquatica]MDN3568584.1 signal peptidase II [Paeniroseomonas aquatica]
MFRSPHHPFRAGLLALIAAFTLDQGTKWWIAEVVMQPPQTIPVAPFFNLMFHRNTGVSFGLFAGNGEAGRWALVAVALAVIAMLCVWMVRAERAWVGVALGLIAGGAISNVVDRLRHGGVTDFLDFHYAGWHWPSFNLADAAICVGVALLLLDGFLRERRQETAGIADGRQP